MTITTISSRKFNQDAGGAKRAAANGPVIITDRGRPAHVLLNYAEYLRLTRQGPSLLDVVAMPGGEHIEFEAPKLKGPLSKSVDLD
ncbi:MAG TPA: type II toxin-antitoxin system Phd/YefM family antitoxin [Hyphomicrobiaceae bacterium]|nr:type II toxin-antitoxin system Phd/YefM family antitoxin [Hyphomicrobiaceae bacterium]